MNKRRSGILLHISSLPGGDGIGTMGKEAFGFVDFLCETQQSVWQILPLGQTGFGNSPYSSFSAFGGNILFIDLQKLSEQFYCEFEPIEFEDPKHVDYEKVKAYKMPILNQAAENFLNNTTVDKTDYLQFNQQNEYWLNDFAFFMALKDFYENKPLLEFDEDIRLRKPEAMLKYQTNLGKEIETIKILQYFFF